MVVRIDSIRRRAVGRYLGLASDVLEVDAAVRAVITATSRVPTAEGGTSTGIGYARRAPRSSLGGDEIAVRIDGIGTPVVAD